MINAKMPASDRSSADPAPPTISLQHEQLKCICCSGASCAVRPSRSPAVAGCGRRAATVMEMPKVIDACYTRIHISPPNIARLVKPSLDHHKYCTLLSGDFDATLGIILMQRELRCHREVGDRLLPAGK